MKRLALVAAGAAVAGLTACTSSVPSAAPAGSPAGTSSSAAAGSSAAASSPGTSASAVSANCKQQYDNWKHGPGKGLVAAVSAVSSAGEAGDVQVLTEVLHKTKPALAKAARYPMPVCADPKGYWAALLMHVNAAAASRGSAGALTGAMKGVPTLTRELKAELEHADR